VAGSGLAFFGMACMVLGVSLFLACLACCMAVWKCLLALVTGPGILHEGQRLHTLQYTNFSYV
jgi:hypothetical protein